MKRLLIIEDDPITARIYKTRLEREGFVVEVAKDGPTGLARLREAPPDAVLLDLMLPQLSGVEILRQARAEARFQDLPMLVFTNAYIPNLVNEALQAGATQVFNKATLNPKQLLDTLKG